MGEMDGDAKEDGLEKESKWILFLRFSEVLRGTKAKKTSSLAQEHPGPEVLFLSIGNTSLSFISIVRTMKN